MSRLVLSLLLTLSLASPKFLAANEMLQQGDPNPIAAAESSRLKDQPQLIVKAPLGDGQEAIISYTEVSDTTPEEAIEILRQQEVVDSDIILSTDNETIAEVYVEDSEKPQSKRFLRLIPVGRLAATQERIASSFNKFYTNATHTLKYDRIGLGVLAITVGVDSYIWVNATDLTIFQKTNMVIFNLAMAATFGLDRDLWGRLNTPLKEKMIRTFDRFIPTNKAQVLKSMSSRYLSNMFLGTGIQLTRTGLLSADHIQEAIMTSDFWVTAAKLSALVTLTSFGWSELYHSIDANTHPKAKLLMRRLSDIRSVIMVNLATVSMVLQPQVYGNSPIISYVVHGAAGLAALGLAHRLVQQLENHPVTNWMYKKMQTLESYINSGLSVIKADVERPAHIIEGRPADSATQDSTGQVQKQESVKTRTRTRSAPRTESRLGSAERPDVLPTRISNGHAIRSCRNLIFGL